LASKERTRTCGTRLTTHERKVLQLIAEGKTHPRNRDRISLQLKTAQTHRGNFMQRLHQHSTSEVVLYAIRNQIIPANSHAA
jgi:DNA-binding NarL/FixJ family response regulator